MNKKLHTLRLSYENWETDNRFFAILELLDKYKDCFDMISLLSSSTHAPLSMEENVRRVNIMHKRMQSLKEHGFSSGINLLTTIGHHEEDLKNAFNGDYHLMTNINGQTCKGSFCMNDERFINDYVRPLYTMLAKTNPDHIWVDDDVRYGHLPIGFGCFCDCCIEKFNQKNGFNYTRETLATALTSSDVNLRKAWLDKNSNAICNLFNIIADTVYSINPNITLGFMTGERYMEGYQFKNYADSLSQNGKHQIMWRPGGGAYTDYSFNEIVSKCEEIGRQSAYLPPYVTIIQSELENFPYQLIKKTPTSTISESVWAMTSGCTGTAFNIVPGETFEPVNTIEAHFNAIKKTLPFYKLLNEKIGGKQPVGIHTGWRIDSQAAVPKGTFTNYYGGALASYAHETFEFGLPQCYDKDNASIVFLKGEVASTWTDEEIENALSKAVYMDAFALDYLNKRGFSHLTGFKMDKEIPIDAREYYLQHPLNSGFDLTNRNARQAFNKGDSYSIIKTNEKAQVVSAICDYHDNILADCTTGIFENDKGGRICVCGYYPFTWVCDYHKTIQLKRIMQYLSRNALPSFVDSYCRIRNHTFIVGNKIYIALLNPTNQLLNNVKVKIKTNKNSGVCFNQNATSYSINIEKTQGDPYRVGIVKELLPYQMVLLEI